MAAAVKAGAAYFALVFACGFVLGAVRVTWLAPTVGATRAVLVELPFMLIVSWLACGWTLRRFHVPSAVLTRAGMGILAFGLLIGAELMLSLVAFGGSPAAFLAAYRNSDAVIGLAGQLVFAALPLVRARKGAA